MKAWTKWLLIGVTAAVVIAVGGPFVYIHFVEGKAAAPLSIGTSPAPAGSSGSMDGSWKVASGSVAGYRVKEVLMGQDNTAVGRTSNITGAVTVKGTTVENGSFIADMTAVRSDKERRDAQFQGRIMDTSTYPTAKFEFSRPVNLAPLPSAGQPKTVSVPGKLTLHGTTKDVTVTVTCRRTGTTAQLVGSIPITFADYNIPNPSFGPVTTQDHGVLEFSLKLEHA
jgi:polyisoprenoid-binding protein YceI